MNGDAPVWSALDLNPPQLHLIIILSPIDSQNSIAVAC